MTNRAETVQVRSDIPSGKVLRCLLIALFFMVASKSILAQTLERWPAKQDWWSHGIMPKIELWVLASDPLKQADQGKILARTHERLGVAQANKSWEEAFFALWNWL